MATTYGKQYVDFDMDFTTHPSTGDLSTVKKSTAINRSIQNLLSTKINERLFQPNTDNGIEILLFENFNRLTSSRLETAIKKTIDKYEPRANLLTTIVSPNIDGNSISLTIHFTIKNISEPATLQLILERTR